MSNSKKFEPICQGALSVRLAENEAEVEAAQRLRYRVFCEEMGASASQEVQTQKRDHDKYDPHCDHVLVIDDSRPEGEKIVGTYRLLTRTNMQALGGFYTETEYDIERLKTFDGEIMELGRSCVEVPYRTRPVIQLLWKGIGAFVSANDITLMFGCASFSGTDPKAHQLALAYLHHHHMAPEEIRPRALDEYYTNINLMAKEAVDPNPDDAKVLTSVFFTLRNVPAALYKGLGGFATNGVNMIKLESYIRGGANNAAQFFMTFEGHPQQRSVQLALEELGFFTINVKLLGVYPADEKRYKLA